MKLLKCGSNSEMRYISRLKIAIFLLKDVERSCSENVFDEDELYIKKCIISKKDAENNFFKFIGERYNIVFIDNSLCQYEDIIDRCITTANSNPRLYFIFNGETIK